MPAEGQDPRHRAAGVLASGDTALEARGRILLPERAPAAVARIGGVFSVSALCRGGCQRTCRPGRKAAGRAAQDPLAGCPRRRSHLPVGADSGRRVPRSSPPGTGRKPDRCIGRVPLSQDNASRSLRRRADRLPRGRRRAALQSTRRGDGDHSAATSWSAAATTFGRRPYRAACCRGPIAPNSWPKARSASAWSRWKCFPSATSCSSSIPCGFGGRHGLSVRATLDHLPQNFGRKLAERIDDELGLAQFVARATSTGQAHASHAGGRGRRDADRGVFDHHAPRRRHAQSLRGDEKDLRIGLAVPHVDAVVNSAMLLPCPTPAPSTARRRNSPDCRIS